MRRAAFALLAFASLATAAWAAEGWSRYLNARYGYATDLPPGFSPVHEADNGDGGVSRSQDGQSELSVWGTNLLLGSISEDVRERIERAGEDGWQISYKKVGDHASSWSGEREGRIFYARAVLLCHDDQAGYFQLEYPAAAREQFDGIVRRLVKNFKPTDCL